MQDEPELVQLTPQVMILPAEEYDALVEWLEVAEDQDYPKLKVLFDKPSPFTKDCE